jgi:hypothetical protein
MKKVAYNTKLPIQKDCLVISDTLQIIDLPALIDKMKKDRTIGKGELKAKILLKSPVKQILLTILDEGTKINSCQSNDSFTFQVIEGKLQLRTDIESATSIKGQLLSLNRSTKYNLKTREETVILLTIANRGMHQLFTNNNINPIF